MAHIGFRRAQLELDESNLGFFNPRRSVLTCDEVLVKHHPGDKLGVLDRAPNLLHDPHVTQINIRGTRSGDTRDSFDGDGGENGRVLGNDFRV